MATVYLVEGLRHERKVALKVLKPELAAVVGAERFLAEIKTTANLQHPHILPLFDSGQADSFLYYVMPYVEGESLRERLDRDHQLPVDEAVGIATNMAEALDYAHRQRRDPSGHQARERADAGRQAGDLGLWDRSCSRDGWERSAHGDAGYWLRVITQWITLIGLPLACLGSDWGSSRHRYRDGERRQLRNERRRRKDRRLGTRSG